MLPSYEVILVDVGNEFDATGLVATGLGAVEAATVLSPRRALRGFDGEAFVEHLRVVRREVNGQIEGLC